MSKIIKFACMQEPRILTNNFIVKEEKTVEEVVVDPSIANELITSAREEAANIIAEAKMAMEVSLTEAKQLVEQIKQQAYDEGHQTGYQEGITQGKKAGLDEMQQVIHEGVVKAQQTLSVAEKQAKDMILAAERQIVEIALALASKVLASEITENPLVVLPVVKAALDKVRDQEQIVIRVSVQDFDAVLQVKQDLQVMVGGEHVLKITADHTLENGSCVIDTSYGMVDARIDTQFDTLKKALQGVLP
ncbi:FliH/SctL family protein [Pelosinus sp. UFO1]|uniref:FliH/SctL family protein n=1 Tax=Pelosinus sp. UFO1 TaxID=484770 RepID=UPI0004D0E03B|nr:FliH/SctL family protein [Pelosinus sp. UFO1]AIF52127.1 Flagellar assembly protein FliH/Type III secretion system HrpE [Pelosinus sp. UFO1]